MTQDNDKLVYIDAPQHGASISTRKIIEDSDGLYNVIIIEDGKVVSGNLPSRGLQTNDYPLHNQLPVIEYDHSYPNTRKHKPNTGLKMGSYRYKSSKK